LSKSPVTWTLQLCFFLVMTTYSIRWHGLAEWQHWAKVVVSLNWIQAAIAAGFKLDSYSASNIGLPVRI